MSISLYDHQKKAIKELKNGSILCGGVGTGKSRTSLAYYYIRNGGKLDPFEQMKNPKDLYIITTARKRDELEWEGEFLPFLISNDKTISPYKDMKVVVDSWNNIKKYVGVDNAFFIFDEQRVVGSGTWVKSFLKITKVNEWILLSATPGDSWIDYIPVFIANGFYKNRTEFKNDHVVYDYRSKFPKVDRYLNTGKLLRLRNSILVDMKFERKTVPHHEDIFVNYDTRAYKDIFKNRWNYTKDQPIENSSELCYELRKVVNSDPSRLEELYFFSLKKRKVIVFYNFDYELDLIKEKFEGTEFIVAEWNGHKHQPVPEGSSWIYLVQYNAGSEAWNCIKTDTIIFYSQNYSYKMMIQASGRIDRLNTPFTDLYYYHFKSKSGIDLAISKALKSKKKFNELKFLNET